MSAIVGVYLLNGQSVDRADLERMLERVAHRGPDGAGVWSEGAAGLGHGMLWTTPESLREKLPLMNKTGNLVLTADARIDNRDELIAALDLHGRPQNEITDSELIIASYDKWGERCPEKLLGDFAFAIWDGRRQLLFCARDHFGVKPFYYHYRSGRIFVFASEIKALLCLQEVPRKLNETRVADYLVPMLEDKVITFYQDILRLPPAHTMTVSREGISLRPYWALDPSRELRLGSDEEYAEAFREIFTDAVRCRLRSAFPVGSMLSGGLDSSSIVCVARQLLAMKGEQRLHTFSAIFDDVPQCDERPFINAVLAQGGLEHNSIHGDTMGPLSDINLVLWHQDEPFWNLYMFMHWALCKGAHGQGVRIFMDGFGGDFVVSYGVSRLVELARAGKWKTLAIEVIGLSNRLNRSPWRILRESVLSPLAPDPIRHVWRTLHGRNRPAWTTNTTINPDFASRIGLAERFEASQGSRQRPAHTSREGHWRDLVSGVYPFGMEVFDRTGAAFSIELRYPFFDKRLAEYCLAIPSEQKLHHGYTRVVERRAMANTLPTEVRWRGGKADFSPNFMRGLLTFDRELLEEVIFKDSVMIEAYVNVAALHKVYARHAHPGLEHDILAVWSAVTLALWLRYACLTP